MVRNFVLNPLQVLQSWEKTMSVDCYTRGQGPMQLASLIVQTLPLDGDCHSASEEVSDPNCGEAAIGRVAPVDSGILLLRAYGKSTGRPLQIQPVESTEWMPEQVGYFIGNLQPARMDFRVFPLESLWSIVGSLATTEQAEVILDLLETRWTDFVGNMPLKTCFLALEGEEWRIITNIYPETTLWSHHNGGSRPTLLWQMLHGALVPQFTVACIRMKGPQLAQRAVEVAEKRISKDRWPEHYDTRTAWLNIEKQSRLYQIGSVVRLVLANPHTADMLTCEAQTVQAKPCLLEEAKTDEQGHVNGARDESDDQQQVPHLFANVDLEKLYLLSRVRSNIIVEEEEEQEYYCRIFFFFARNT